MQRTWQVLAALCGLIAAGGSEASGFGFPLAVIDFEERPREVTSLEFSLATAQESCIETLRAEGRPVRIRLQRPEELIVARRSVRAHYDGERMAWHQVDRSYQLDEASCELRLNESRSVTVVDRRSSRQWNVGPDGHSERVDLPVLATDLARSPPSIPPDAPTRTVAGQPCSPDEVSIEGSAPFARGTCYWRHQRRIRDLQLQYVPLYSEIIDVVSGRSSSVWQATRIAVGERSPESAFRLPRD